MKPIYQESLKGGSMRMIRKFAIALVFVATASLGSVSAEDTPRGLWIKLKCALCHGEDGASSTPTGKKVGAPDLRTAEVQDLDDETLTKRVREGYGTMPAFKRQLKSSDVKMLVYYIRELREDEDDGDKQ